MATAGSSRSAESASPGRALLIALLAMGVLTPIFVGMMGDLWAAGTMAGKYAFTGIALLLLIQFLLGLVIGGTLLHRLFARLCSPFNDPLARAIGLDPESRAAPLVVAVCVCVVMVSLFGVGDLPPPWLIVLRGLI